MWSESLDNGKIKYCERYTDALTLKSKKVSVTLSGRDTATNRRKAMELLAKKIETAQNGIITKQMTLRELFEAYKRYQSRTMKASTTERNNRTLEKLVVYLGEDAVIENLNAAYIKDKLLAMDGKKLSTLNEYLKRLRAMFRWGYNQEYYDTIFFNRLVNFNEPVTHREKIQDKFLEPEELGKLLSYMKDSHENWYYVTRIMALTGMRIGELQALTVQDLDDTYIHFKATHDNVNDLVTTAKTVTSERDVYIQPELQQALKEYRHWRRLQDLMLGIRSDQLFHDSKGNIISYYAYEKYLKETGQRILQKNNITTHVLRHTHVSLLAAAKVDLDTISRRVGHEDSRITKQIYLHITKKLRELDNEQIRNTKLL